MRACVTVCWPMHKPWILLVLSTACLCIAALNLSMQGVPFRHKLNADQRDGVNDQLNGEL